ncbi:hypothetical protein Vretimale_18892 [Volvox reticuliferus]|uniref:Methyltransferase type 11 domain-containing protein n=2 Tax=Volvox reticuliferus TaxID=1737510 RepID=A0A8J4GZP6_9CHLO|nr:hypothetical protein Vretifemale_17282 [Volvox reticuliferus]GIL89471.1 hypothetical protein Vretifemale_17282 [Volvox reticuliferus]GIM16296.1 hypothetical protein Vretimale_18892 [Volvox reticuliferus]GIM16298.1 hypothetical protein Vretimale_18892 [Volvox reticuliferus]
MKLLSGAGLVLDNMETRIMRCGSTTKMPSCSARNVFASRPSPRKGLFVRAESMTSSSVGDKPAWTGDSLLSKVVNWAIDTPPLYNTLKVFAKQMLINSAESRGVPWGRHVAEMEKRKEIEVIKSEVENPALCYPDYYLKPFHAYENGNLEWLAAFEVQPATYVMAIRTFKDKTDWSGEQCFVELRSRITNAIKSYHVRHGLPLPSIIADMGCSTGMSTTWLSEQFPDANITGLDLSPYFLAVAEWERRHRAATSPSSKQRSAPITYVHGLAEQSPFADASLDLVNFNFVIHECPQATISSFIRESQRVLRPGGVLAIVDNNPKSATIQNLPPFLFTTMKSTEPWSDEYYSFDVEAAMRDAGFREVVTVETDHRHRCVMGIRT